MSDEKTPRWASVAEAAEYARVNEKTIRRAYTDGHIGRYPFGRVVRVDLNEVDEFMGKPAA